MHLYLKKLDGPGKGNNVNWGGEGGMGGSYLLRDLGVGDKELWEGRL